MFVRALQGFPEPCTPRPAPVLAFIMLITQFNACSFGEEAKCFTKFLAEVFLDKSEAVARSTAGVALVEGGLFVGHHSK